MHLTDSATNNVRSSPAHVAAVAATGLLGAVAAIVGSGMDPRSFYFLPLAIFIPLYECFRKRHHKPWDFLTVIHVVFFLAYVLGPAHSILSPSKVNHFYGYQPPTGSIEPAAFSIYLGYLAIVLGYGNGHRIGNAWRRWRMRSGPSRRRGSSPVLAWTLIVFSALSFLAYAQAYDGPAALISSSAKIRGTHGAESGAVVFRHFMPFANLGVWLLLCRYLEGRRGVRRVLPILIALPVALIVPFANAGRGDALILIIPAVVGPFVLMRRWPPMKVLVPLIAAASVWILGGKLFFADLSYNTDPSLPDTPTEQYFALISEFTIPFESLTTAVDRVGREVPPRYVADITRGLLELVPSRMIGATPSTDDNVTVINSTAVASKRSHFLPPGLVGYFYYAGFVAGVVIGGFLLGLSVALVEARLLMHVDIHSFSAFVYVAAALSIGQYIMAGDPRVYILSYFWLYVGGWVVLRTLNGSVADRCGGRLPLYAQAPAFSPTTASR